MAKKSKQPKKSEIPEVSTDETIEPTATADETTASEAADTPDDTTENTAVSAEDEGIEDAPPSEDDSEDDTAEVEDNSDDQPDVLTLDDPTEPLSDDTPTPVTAAAEETSPQQRNPFFPMLLGGVAAAAIGMAGAKYILPESWLTNSAPSATEARLAELEERLNLQTTRLKELQGKALEGGAEALTALQSEVANRIETLETRLGDAETSLKDMAANLTGLAEARLSNLSDTEIAAYTDALAAQRDEIAKMLDEARNLDLEAQKNALQTQINIAVNAVEDAIENGEPFKAELDELRALGVDTAEQLTTLAENGVKDLTELAEAFPDAAREALATARKDGGESGVSAFFKKQIGLRSLEAREGSDPDAVLSRAEAALRDGRLTDAISELETLPESARADLTAWITDVTNRLEAKSALRDLRQSLN